LNDTLLAFVEENANHDHATSHDFNTLTYVFPYEFHLEQIQPQFQINDELGRGSTLAGH